MREIGIKRTAEGIFCEQCGNDLSVEGSKQFVMHADGAKFYQNVYKCTSCGNMITQVFERSKRW